MKSKRAWPVLILLGVLFVLPAAVAGGILLSGWRPAPSAAHGRLISPPLPLAGVVLGEAGGRAVRLEDFRERWTLLYFGPADCGADCRSQLYAMRQVHLAQGRGQGRVQRVFVARGELSAEAKSRLSDAYPGMSVVAQRGDLSRRWPEQGKGRIFLVDPIGNLVMQYEPNADASGMRSDLARLLAYSWVG